MPSFNNEETIRIRDIRPLANAVRFLQLLWSIGRLQALLLALLTLALGLIPVAEVVLTGRLIDAFSEVITAGGQSGSAYGTLALLALMMALRNWTRLLAEHVEDGLREEVSHKLRYELLEKAYRSELAFYEMEESYEALQRANQSLGTRLVNIYSDALSMIQDVTTATGFLVALATAHWLPAALVLAAAVPSAWFKMTRARQRYIFDYDTLTPTRRRLSYFRGLVSSKAAAKEVRLFQLGGHFVDRWAEHQEAWKRETLLDASREARAGVAADALVAVSFGVAAVAFAALIAGGGFTIGYYVMMLRVIVEFQGSVESLLYGVRNLFQDALFAQNLFEFLDRPVESAARGSVRFPAPLADGIRFEDVWFRYPNGDDWVLKGVTFHVAPGETISLVGRNGAGKSTLVKLLMGMYRPQRGRILFDGIPLERLDEEDLRRNMSAIFQDFLKLELTLRESIGFGDVSAKADMERIVRAASMSGADKLAAALPDGYETMLSKAFGGTELSGGEWQKVALARCLMRDAEVLVLDEPSASLDPRAEVGVFEEFKRLAKGRTSFLISHRIGTARLADRILVLQDGRLIDAGTHDELVRRGGEYATLFALQAQWYTDAS